MEDDRLQDFFRFLAEELLAASGAAGGRRRQRDDLAQGVEEAFPQASHQPGDEQFPRRRLAEHVQADGGRLVVDFVQVGFHALDFVRP